MVENIFGGEVTDIPLFRNLSRQEVALVLRRSTMVRAQFAHTVIRAGLRDEYMCVVLSGRLESHYAGHTLETLGKGDCCRETEFLTDRPRMIEVVAREAAELLILPTEYLAQLIDKNVTVGRMLLKNLAVAMANGSVARVEALRSCCASRVRVERKTCSDLNVRGRINGFIY
jgi:CRP-like cAMP-binding protein